MSVPHAWRRDSSGDIDWGAFQTDIHEGPECERCGMVFCENCEFPNFPEWLTEPCIQYDEIPGQLDIYDMLEET